MGADLYNYRILRPIRVKYGPLFDKAAEQRNKANERGDKEKADKKQKLVDKYYDFMYTDEGYFRDSYNYSNLLWALGFDWWDWFAKNFMTKRTCCMKPDKAEKLRKIIAETPLKKGFAAQCARKAKESTKIWTDYFEDRRECFLKFLDVAIENGDTIECSI